jgi:cytochrome subunit of sulfide dehydrogenase
MTGARFMVLMLLLIAGSVRDARAAPPGEALADGCTSCHGIQGRSRGYIPSLDRLSRADFTRAMIDFRAQKRTATIMNRIARVYSDEDIALLADYFAAGASR